MPKLTYAEYTAMVDPYNRDTRAFVNAGDSLKDQFEEVRKEMDAWAGSDEAKKAQIRPLREKIENPLVCVQQSLQEFRTPCGFRYL